MDILDKIISIMDEKRITQKQLTDYLGLQNTAFTKWKAGSNTSYLKYVTQIATFLNVSSDYLLGIEDKDNQRLKNVEFAFNNFTEEDMQIMKRTNELPAKKKKAILNLLDALEEDND